MPNFKKTIYTLFFSLLTITAVFDLQAYAQGENLPKNVRIEVEFKEYGESEKDIFSATYRKDKSSDYTKQFIVVSDGLSASIWVGQTVPYLTYYREYLYDHGYIEEGLILKEVGTKLKVTPRIKGDLVEITLTPQISFISDRKKGIIDIKTLTTCVVVKNHHSIEIGGLQKDAQFEECFFKSSSQSNLKIVLTAHIE
ncbi:MAG: hypothetical protein AMJ78_08760 [Omnitrophica WOR_2 bacterium SM23_29]|nr:MAG: hypothetical protein AMJ78_08760 [Omnitrophica WOR_2 bacterium SM23_29]